MGTTESILLDEASERQAGGSIPDGSSSGVGRAGQQQLQPQPRIRQRQSIRGSQGGVAGNSSHSSLLSGNVTPRAGNAPPPITTAVRMHGMVLGMSQSGKQTLLSRLEGKDPFTDSNLDDYSQRPAALVPYRPPPNQPIWDRIQLQIQVSRTVKPPTSKSSNTNRAVDFAVLLINPTHDRARIQNFLMETIADLLQLQGYDIDNLKEEGNIVQQEDNEEINHSSSSHNRRTGGRRRQYPFCLCLLLNFRDRFVPKMQDKWLGTSDVQMLTLEILQKFAPTLEPDRLVLQCGNTSMVNCYGLDLLHHFIYQSYLQRKRCNLESFIQQVHDASIESNRSVPSTTYEEFLSRLSSGGTTSSEQQQQQQHQQQQQQQPERRSSNEASQAGTCGKPKNDRQEKQQRKSLTGSSQMAKQTEEGHIPQRKDVTSRRKIVPEHRPPGKDMVANGQRHEQSAAQAMTKLMPYPQQAAAASNTVATSRAALEAFLASDSDNDEGATSKNNTNSESMRTDTRGQYKGFDSEDDDDEFFYDESGHRQHLVSRRAAPARPLAATTTRKATEEVAHDIESARQEEERENQYVDHDEDTSHSNDDNAPMPEITLPVETHINIVRSNSEDKMGQTQLEIDSQRSATQSALPESPTSKDLQDGKQDGSVSPADPVRKQPGKLQQQVTHESPPADVANGAPTPPGGTQKGDEIAFVKASSTSKRDSVVRESEERQSASDNCKMVSMVQSLDSTNNDVSDRTSITAVTTGTPKAPNPPPASSDSEDDEFFVEEIVHDDNDDRDARQRKSSPSPSNQYNGAQKPEPDDDDGFQGRADGDDDDDDGAFVISEPGASYSPHKSSRRSTKKANAVGATAGAAPQAPRQVVSVPGNGGGGLSAAAMAAIAAAQREAEMMLHGGLSAPAMDEYPKKEKKKKKSKEEKKKKKEKKKSKEKSSRYDDVDLSD